MLRTLANDRYLVKSVQKTGEHSDEPERLQFELDAGEQEYFEFMGHSYQ